MNIKVFSLYDIKAKVFQTPFFMQNQGTALRAFSDLVNDERSFVNKHPEDYQLYHVGDFDDEKALFTNKTPVDLVATASEFLKQKPMTAQQIVDAIKVEKQEA